MVADRGILFQTDWWHNTAGVMFAWEEVCKQEKADINHAYKVISEVMPRHTRENLEEAKNLALRRQKMLIVYVKKSFMVMLRFLTIRHGLNNYCYFILCCEIEIWRK